MNDLLYLIANTPIEYKEILNVPSNVSFGCEIEFENAPFEEVKRDMGKIVDTKYVFNKDEKEYNSWIIEDEFDCISNKNDCWCGGEINSPISINTKEFWNDLQQICCVLKNNDADFTSAAGFHIHLNKKILLPKVSRWLKLLKTWIVFEDEFIKLYNGERDSQREIVDYYAQRISEKLYIHFFENQISSYKSITQIMKKFKKFDADRIHDLVFYTPNVCNKTFELRACNGTDNEIIIQQFFNIFISMFMMINSERSDEFIDELFNDYENERLFIYPETLYKLFDEMFSTIEDKAAALRLYYKDTRYTPLTK